MDEDEVDGARSSDETRHAILAAAVATSLESLPGEGAESAAVSGSPAGADPALLAWREWQETHQLRDRLWREQQRLDAAEDEGIGIGPSSDDDANRLDEDLAAREDALAADLFATPAITILGVIAKLDAMLAVMEPGPGCEDEPWPQIRAVVEDLGQLAANVAALRG